MEVPLALQKELPRVLSDKHWDMATGSIPLPSLVIETSKGGLGDLSNFLCCFPSRSLTCCWEFQRVLLRRVNVHWAALDPLVCGREQCFPAPLFKARMERQLGAWKRVELWSKLFSQGP